MLIVLPCSAISASICLSESFPVQQPVTNFSFGILTLLHLSSVAKSFAVIFKIHILDLKTVEFYPIKSNPGYNIVNLNFLLNYFLKYKILFLSNK